jgi:hypothetical protein
VSSCWVGRVSVNADRALDARSVVGLSGRAVEGEGEGGREKSRRAQKRRSGRHAGHVLPAVEKGTRAVKGLQQPCAGCTGHQGTESRAVHTSERKGSAEGKGRGWP